MRNLVFFLGVLGLPILMPLPIAASIACGGEKACDVAGGDYRIKLPADGDVRGAYVFFHGYKSSAELQMQQRYLVETTLRHHLAYVAVDGIGGNWSFPNGARQGRDDQAFVANVFADLQSRFGFSSQNTIIGGFSIGASMAFYTACQQGKKSAAMITFSGVFWDPLPKSADCQAEPPPMIHFHGTADETFPLAGRQVSATAHQGDTFKSVAVMRERGKCDLTNRKAVTIAGIVCDDIPNCLRGENILCIHDGGHEARAELLDGALDQLGYKR